MQVRRILILISTDDDISTTVRGFSVRASVLMMK
jgi:hypothetical protein